MIHPLYIMTGFYHGLLKLKAKKQLEMSTHYYTLSDFKPL
jgi:hypothetical protein